MILPTVPTRSRAIVEEVDRRAGWSITWRVLYDPTMAEEPPSRVEWLLDAERRRRDQGDDDPWRPRAQPEDVGEVGYGWTWVLDSMKSLLETGEPLPGEPLDPPVDEAATDDAEAEAHRRMAIDANNSTWELLGARRPVR